MYPLPVHPPLSLTHNPTSPYPSSTARPIPYQQQRGVESSSEAWKSALDHAERQVCQAERKLARQKKVCDSRVAKLHVSNFDVAS